MARPTKQTPETISKLEQAFSLGCTVSEACFQAGVAESTYYEWCNLDAELSERMKALKNHMILKARQTIFNNLDDVSTAKWYLERKRKDEFSIKVENKYENVQPVVEAETVYVDA
jgi:hypothetical protein